jgi:ketosteroid isomerase-like protein
MVSPGKADVLRPSRGRRPGRGLAGGRLAAVCLSVVVGLFAADLAGAPPPPTDDQAVAAAVEGFLRAYERGDAALAMGMVVEDEAAVFFGTSGDPVRGTRALKSLLEREAAALKDTKLEIQEIRAKSVCGGAAGWVTALYGIRAVVQGRPVGLRIKATFVLEKKQQRWLIVHWHQSIAGQA